ncbi:MAG: pyridoxal phosphate-dependent aminotransferase [Clostridiales bacterium]|nr:pyridoxal phosphate-dependent aminotransferase [Clostridiales bacterium]
MISDKMQIYIDGSSAIRALFEESKKLAEQLGAENVFDFSLGNPNFPPPAAFGEAVKKYIDAPDQNFVNGYMNNSGYPEVRARVAESLNRRFGTAYAEHNIIMTVGAAGGLNTMLAVLMNAGEEVMTFAPFFGEYFSYATNVDANLVVVPPNPPAFAPNVAAFAPLVTEKTRAVILNSPNNPSGVIYGEDDLRAIADVLREKQRQFGTDIYILCDEPYRELNYTDREVPWMPDYYNNTIVGYSWSKSLSIPGDRIGYLVIPDEVTDSPQIVQGGNIMTRTLGFVNAPALMQLVCAACVDLPVDISGYRKNRNALWHGLTGIGYTCVEPQGAFYLFVKSPLEDDKAFVEAAKPFGLVVVPGSGFGAPGWLRLAYCTSYVTIERSLPQFKALWDSVNK